MLNQLEKEQEGVRYGLVVRITKCLMRQTNGYLQPKCGQGSGIEKWRII